MFDQTELETFPEILSGKSLAKYDEEKARLINKIKEHPFAEDLESSIEFMFRKLKKIIPKKTMLPMFSREDYFAYINELYNIILRLNCPEEVYMELFSLSLKYVKPQNDYFLEKGKKLPQTFCEFYSIYTSYKTNPENK